VIVAGETVFRDGALTRVTWNEVLDGLREVTRDWPQQAGR
jgi:hypothetical protein